MESKVCKYCERTTWVDEDGICRRCQKLEVKQKAKTAKVGKLFCTVCGLSRTSPACTCTLRNRYVAAKAAAKEKNKFISIPVQKRDTGWTSYVMLANSFVYRAKQPKKEIVKAPPVVIQEPVPIIGHGGRKFRD